MFRLRGAPFSLEDYLQMRTMYPREYSPEGIWLTGRQVSKTTNLAYSEIMDMVAIPNFHILYVAPLKAQANRYSRETFAPALQSCRVAVNLQSHDLEGELSDSKIVRSVSVNTLANGAAIELTYAKTSPDRARGIFADRIDFDEVQNQLVDNIPIISESLLQSAYGIRRYTGTAMTTDNTIEKLWRQSSMCEWAVRCPSCGHWNVMSEDGGILNMIRSTGMHCVGPRCAIRPRLNVRDGVFVPAKPDLVGVFDGHHIPQVAVPAVVDDPRKWGRVINKLLKLPLTVFKQEVLGISCSLGARMITEDHIRANSTLPPVAELRKLRGRYVSVIMGIDWGGAEMSSFTVMTVLGLTADGEIHCIYARRFAGMDPDEIFSEVAKAYMYYRVEFVAADYGMGFSNNVMLENQYGLRVVQMNFCSSRALMTYRPTLGHSRWMLDRTTALTIMFMAVRYGRVKFPPYAEFKTFTDDLLSPYEHVRDDGGVATRMYLRDPHRPDDFCMALTFAAMLMMKLSSGSVSDMVPEGAFGYPGGGAPDITDIDPESVLDALGA